jgi:hypothetical protein
MNLVLSIDRAMIKFPKAKRSRVENFTNSYSKMTLVFYEGTALGGAEKGIFNT